MIARDLTTEIDVLPRSHLSKLEDQMPLPLGCDESTLSHLERSTRIIYLFFLAETSLKEIVARINTMCLETLPELGRKSAKVRISPVALELKNQLVVWEESVPQSLGWSPQPSEDACSALHTRLKLIYWLAQFHLFEPLVMAVMNNVHAEFNFDVWSSVVHGLSAGYTLVKVLVWEKTQVDSVMGKR